jgi:hypothetical protein
MWEPSGDTEIGGAETCSKISSLILPCSIQGSSKIKHGYSLESDNLYSAIYRSLVCKGDECIQTFMKRVGVSVDLLNEYIDGSFCEVPEVMNKRNGYEQQFINALKTKVSEHLKSNWQTYVPLFDKTPSEGTFKTLKNMGRKAKVDEVEKQIKNGDRTFWTDDVELTVMRDLASSVNIIDDGSKADDSKLCVFIHRAEFSCDGMTKFVYIPSDE